MKFNSKTKFSKSQYLDGQIINSKSGKPLNSATLQVLPNNSKRNIIQPIAKTLDDGSFRLNLSAVLDMEVLENSTVMLFIKDAKPIRLSSQALLEAIQNGFWEILTPVEYDTDSVIISHLYPSEVLPGSFLEIHGSGLEVPYGKVEAWFGEQEALVISIQEDKIIIRIPLKKKPLEILRLKIDNQLLEITTDLQWGDVPDEGIVGSYGSPITFSGT